MENKVTLIVKATVNTEDIHSFNTYIERLTALFEKMKAKQIGHYPVKETFVGNDSPTFIAIFELADRETLNAIYKTEEYINTMIPLRDKGFKKLEVYLS